MGRIETFTVLKVNIFPSQSLIYFIILKTFVSFVPLKFYSYKFFHISG